MAAGGTLSRWAYPESKLAMLMFAKVGVEKEAANYHRHYLR